MSRIVDGSKSVMRNNLYATPTLDTKKPIRVLMLAPNLRVSNGVTSYAMNYFHKLDHNAVCMDFAVYKYWDTPYEEEIVQAGGKIFILPPVSKLFTHLKACKTILVKGDYDIIHDNSFINTLPMMEIAKKNVRARILHSHSARLGETVINEKRNKLFLPLLLNSANHYAACSEKAGKALFADRQFTVIPNVVHADKFRFNAELRSKMRLAQGVTEKKVVGCVGRLTDAKNPFFAIDVMKKVFQKMDDVVFWWIGNGVLDEQVANYVRECNLENKIVLFGGRTDVSDLLQAMDSFFLPSKSEGFGLACLEASTTGLPCVVSDNFPADVNVTGNVDFVSLNEAEDVWADCIIRTLGVQIDRSLSYDCVNNSACSDLGAGERLYDYYKNILNESGKKLA